MTRAGPALALAMMLTATAGAAQAAPPSREMSTDRPDTTESPYTVERGRLQFETTLFGYAREEDGTDTHEYATTNLRIGLTSRLEADVILAPYGRKDEPGSVTQQGVGDVTLRMKLNLARPDGVERRGEVALALLPFVNIPTDRHDGISDEVWGGGLIAPLDLALGGRFNLGLNSGFVVLREDRARGYETHALLTASLGCEWSERWATFYEVAAELNRGDPAGDIVTVNTGVTYRLRDNLQLDAGVNVGATRAADRVATFVGVSARF